MFLLHVFICVQERCTYTLLPFRKVMPVSRVYHEINVNDVDIVVYYSLQIGVYA